jgi:hypothetical protein
MAYMMSMAQFTANFAVWRRGWAEGKVMAEREGFEPSVQVLARTTV